LRTNISLEEAQGLVMALGGPVGQDWVTLTEAVGRVLSQDVQAGIDLPPFDKSPLDGYALQAGRTKEASAATPARFEVIEQVRAGGVPTQMVGPGTTIKVMTGVPIPNGADTIIKYEDVRREADTVSIFGPLSPGSNVIRAGEDVVRGETLARRGTLITSSLVGLFAAVGLAGVPVFDKVKVAILSTGDELLAPGEKPQPGKIYNSNLHSLLALCLELGAQPVSLGFVPDERGAIAERIGQGLAAADIVVTTGGVSVGDYDLVPDALGELGATGIFRQIDLKPGSPVLASEIAGKTIIGLSGNPAAAIIGFELIAIPAIRQLMGLEKCLPQKIQAVLLDGFAKASPQRRLLRGELEITGGKSMVKFTGEQSNGVLKSMVSCNVLVDVPAGSGPLKAGQEVSALLVGNLRGFM